MRFVRKTLAVAFLVSASTWPVHATIVAEFDGGATNTGLVINAATRAAMAFDVTNSTSVTEIQMSVSRWSGSSGLAVMQLAYDEDGQPGGLLAILSEPVSEVSQSAQWFSFLWFGGGGTSLAPGRYWIILSVTSGSDAELHWRVATGNPYGTGADTKSSFDDGLTWPIIQGADAYFKVYGTRTGQTTTTTVTVDPSTVATSGTGTVAVSVVDAGANPVQGPGQVTLSASGGTLGQTTVTLSGGQASTTWTAPGSTGSRTVTANFVAFNQSGNDYQSSSGNTTVNVVAQQRATTTSLSLSPTSTTTRSPVNVAVTVRDDQSALVGGGTVSFTSGSGSFGSNSVAVVNGTASTTWTAGIATGTFDIDADYSGFDSGSIVFGASSDTDQVDVDYTDVTTSTTVTVSPDYPYVSKKAFVTVETRDSGGVLVPGGTVQLSAGSGWLDANSLSLHGGIGGTIWHAPSSAGGVTISASYQQYLGGGNRYLASSGNDTPTVVEDDDDSSSLTWMSQWSSNYTTNPLPNSSAQSKGFTGALVSKLVWAGAEYSDQNAAEEYMKREADGGRENDIMDVHDFTWYNGHGHPDYITFITDKDDKKLYCSEASRSWGTDDADWAALKTCKALSNPSGWAGTMEGIHLICGFHSNAQSSKTFGSIFAGFMIKDGVWDEPHTIEQAWYLAGDLTHSAGREQRVIAESPAMFDDHIWGQGYVSPDPTPDDYYSDSGIHTIAAPSSPSADAGGPYVATVGVPIQLDGSNSSDADVGNYLFYSWDLDLSANTDAGDWDNDGTNENSDDADVWGRRPQAIFSTPATNRMIRLIVRDDDWNTASDIATVTVAAAGPTSAQPEPSRDGEMEIVDAFQTLPPSGWMPTYDLAGTTVGYTEMMNLATVYGIQGAAGQDDLGNWTLTDGDRELVVNQSTGNVMFVDRARAYSVQGPPPPALPPEPDAIMRAEDFIAANGIQCEELDMAAIAISDLTLGEGGKDSRTPAPRNPYQRRVTIPRKINAWGQDHPVVGPGGRISVWMNEAQEVLSFVKVCRHTQPGMEIELVPAEQAIFDFHRLGVDALIGSSWVPPSDRIEIHNVSIGYYEEDFVTAQNTIYPVYVLDLVCEDDVGSQQTEVYLRADAPPIEVTIHSPADGSVGDYGTALSFSGSAVGGVPPLWFEWYSNIDGFIGDGPLLDAELSMNEQEGEMLAHTITLRVTDAAGWSGEKRVRVTVMPLADPPVPVPDGEVIPGTPMTVDKAGGESLFVIWDATTCGTAPRYNFYAGAIGDYSTVTEALCEYGMWGSATIELAGDSAWWIVTGFNGSDVGSFGRDFEGEQRVLSGWETLCLASSQDTSGTCP